MTEKFQLQFCHAVKKKKHAIKCLFCLIASFLGSCNHSW